MTHSLRKQPPQGIDSRESRDQNTSRAKICSRQLFATQNEVIIEHNGEDYRLRMTRNGKLILTK